MYYCKGYPVFTDEDNFRDIVNTLFNDIKKEIFFTELIGFMSKTPVEYFRRFANKLILCKFVDTNFKRLAEYITTKYSDVTVDLYLRLGFKDDTLDGISDETAYREDFDDVVLELMVPYHGIVIHSDSNEDLNNRIKSMLSQYTKYDDINEFNYYEASTQSFNDISDAIYFMDVMYKYL